MTVTGYSNGTAERHCYICNKVFEEFEDIHTDLETVEDVCEDCCYLCNLEKSLKDAVALLLDMYIAGEEDTNRWCYDAKETLLRIKKRMDKHDFMDIDLEEKDE